MDYCIDLTQETVINARPGACDYMRHKKGTSMSHVDF